MVCKQCNGPIPVRLKGRGRRRTEFCSDTCTDQWWIVHRRKISKQIRAQGRRPKLTPEDRINRVKDRAARKLAAYIEQRRKEIAAGSPRLADMAAEFPHPFPLPLAGEGEGEGEIKAA